MRAYLRYLRRHDVIATDPGRSLRTPKGDARLRVCRARDEAAALLDARRAQPPIDPDADDRSGRRAPSPCRDLAVLEVLYGSRAAGQPSAAGSGAADCDLRRGLRHRARQGRRRSGGCRSANRRVDALVAWLDRRPPAARGARSRPTDAVFLNRRGGALSTRDARRILARYPLATAAPSIPTRSGTRTLRTCSRAAPTCGQCKSSSATPISRRPRSTPTSPATACGPSTRPPIPVPDDPNSRRRRRALDRLQGRRRARTRVSGSSSTTRRW